MGGERSTEYYLGYTDVEAERLIRQGKRLAPVTEHFLREAGIGPGQRVLDVGSGVGEVALILGRLVGPSGAVVGLDRDERSLERARARVREAGMSNVKFVVGDLATFSTEERFDAAVGRYVLQFLPDPAAVLRRLSSAVKPGGIIAFQENSFAPFVALSSHLPLWSTCVNLLHETAKRNGVDVEMGPGLHRAFQDAGLPIPHMRLWMELGYEPEFTSLLSDAIKAVLTRIERAGFSTEPLGDIATLQERLHQEVTRSNTVVPWIALGGAWCRKPAD
ncbi:MAG TPA: class I SAM-dependent methyltransferase [Candidatus Eremiobacteraceae bacterium]|nr:class I SAM-dependent methyltransferase [Candidatus Eremiobacteraceae bacterium]